MKRNVDVLDPQLLVQVESVAEAAGLHPQVLVDAAVTEWLVRITRARRPGRMLNTAKRVAAKTVASTTITPKKTAAGVMISHGVCPECFREFKGKRARTAMGAHLRSHNKKLASYGV